MTRRRALIAVLVVALIGRVLLLASGTVSFHSDEAVVGLMARHILQGERPVFFYGQAYMGSLDAWLIAVGFALLGQSVLTIRIVESILYLLIVAAGYAVAWRLSGRVRVAAVAALVIAVPDVLLAVYTTATLGGYNETLLFGSLILLLGWDVTHEHRAALARWALLGLCAGLGWWSNGLIVAYVLPVGVMILWDIARAGLRPAPTPQGAGDGIGAKRASPLQDTHTDAETRAQRAVPSQNTHMDAETRARRASPLQRYAVPILVALVFFAVGSAPWWGFNFQHDFAALRFYLPSSAPSAFAGNDIPPLPTDQRLIGLFLLGLPAVIGLRFPWQPGYFLPLIAVVVLLIYALAVYRLLRRSPLKPGARALVLGTIALFCALFVVSRFSIDPTGRYFLPLTLPLGILLGTLAETLPLGRIAVAAVLVYNLVGVVTAASTTGLTTQFNLDTNLPNRDDSALIVFLDAHGLVHGYTNYWISFRLAFLSDDRMQYSAALPYKPDLSYTPFDDRYPPYRLATDSAPDAQIAYITALIPEVQTRLEEVFAERAVTYQSAQVGIFRIYYDFAPIAPRPPLYLRQPTVTASEAPE